MTFNEKLKQICKLEGINLREFSELAGVSYGVIKSYSSGRNKPKIAQIDRMTEHPRLAQYRSMLLSIDEDAALDAEILSLYKQLEEQGKGEQALEYLKFLAGRVDK